LATIDQGVILVDSELCHAYNNIKHLAKKANTFTPGLGDVSSGPSRQHLGSKAQARTVWDEIFDMDYIASRPNIYSFEDCFMDYESIVFTGEYSCLRQLLAVYRYVRPKEKIHHMEKINQNIQAKKKMGLSSMTDANTKIGDFVYHRDGLSIAEFMRLMKAFIKRYTTDDDNKKTINKSRMTDRKRVNSLLRGGNLEFCFVYKSFTISISVINLQKDKRDRASMTPLEAMPYISICVLDMSDKYRLGFIEEKDTFKNRLLKSIQHELHTPITYVLARGEVIHSQLQTKYAELWENSDGIEDILYVLEKLGIKKDYQDTISFMSVALYNFTHMCILLKSYSDFASINSPDFILDIEKVNVPEAVNVVVEMYHEFALSKNVSVEVNYPLLENAEDVYAWSTDEMRLQTIVGSLLHNAVKYSNVGGKVRVEIEKKGERLELSVVDNGIGIKKEDLLTLDQVLKNHLLKWTTSNGSGICLGLKLVGS
jgi:anti-sigma regulatory factor (Ser/Thr protein kinase)